MKTIILQTYTDEFQASLSLTSLLDAGIEAHLVGEYGFGRRGGPIKLIIKNSDLDDACLIIEHRGEIVSYPVCPNCKSRSFEEIQNPRGNIISKLFNLIYSALFSRSEIKYRCRKCGYIIES